MSDYTQGVCEDGAAILKDGLPMTIEHILTELRGAQDGGEPVAGEMVSVDVSTCDEDVGNRVFGEIIDWQDDGQGERIWLCSLDHYNYTRPSNTVLADDAKHQSIIIQAQIWAQEARTQKAIVMEIGKLVGCKNDWEMVEAVKAALARTVVPEWTNRSDGFPTKDDADYIGNVWVNDRAMKQSKNAQCLVPWETVSRIPDYTQWMPTGFKRPQPPEQEPHHD